MRKIIITVNQTYHLRRSYKFEYKILDLYYNIYENCINNIRKNYDPLADLILPHITLAFPF